MHLYDVLMLALFVLLAWRGARRGLVRMLVGRLAAFALGVLLAFRLRDPLGAWLATVFPRLSLTAAQIVAFLAIVLLVGVAIRLGTALLTGAIRHVPVVGGLNCLGGLLAGVALGLLGVWLLTTCLLLLPASVAPFVAGVHHSRTVQLVRSLTPQWSSSLRAHAHLEPEIPTCMGKESAAGATTTGRIGGSHARGARLKPCPTGHTWTIRVLEWLKEI